MGKSIEQMRSELMNLYDGASWRARVFGWPTNRVYATYMNCVKYNTFEKQAKKRAEKKKQQKSTGIPEITYQYSIFDYI